MKQIVIDIEDMLERGLTPLQVSENLGIPLGWVTEIEMEIDWSDFARVCKDPSY